MRSFDYMLARRLKDLINVMVVLRDHYSQITTVCFRQSYRGARRSTHNCRTVNCVLIHSHNRLVVQIKFIQWKM